LIYVTSIGNMATFLCANSLRIFKSTLIRKAGGVIRYADGKRLDSPGSIHESEKRAFSIPQSPDPSVVHSASCPEGTCSFFRDKVEDARS
jgi:hypothetical protein